METFDLAGQIFVTLVVVYLVRNAFRKREKAFLRSVAILVLGDIGRSPRMMYHAESFAQSNFQTYLIGYSGSTPIPSLERENVELLYLNQTPTFLRFFPFLLTAPIKIAIQVTSILCTLLIRIPHPPEYIMVQNPPSIPTLAIAQLVCKLRGSKLIIDWHNLGYSILGLRVGQDHIIVDIHKKFEYIFGREADIHLFVTKAMQDKLVKEWDLEGAKQVLHDRPPSNFKKSEAFESHAIFIKLAASLSSPSLRRFFPSFNMPESTPFTHLAPVQVTANSIALDTEISDSYVLFSSPTKIPALRPDRPALLVSSTSWTADEDFGILLKALVKYEKRARLMNEEMSKVAEGGVKPQKRLPKLLTIVTGKGPLKERYMSQIAKLEKSEDWRWVRCRSLWLEAEDYPVLLGSADLGVCLHSSSSGLDLPMKVVDMFGCGLPVCALDFNCLNELVHDGKNGRIFRNDSELASQIEQLLGGFPNATALESLRRSFNHTMPHDSRHSLPRSDGREWEWSTWSENWNSVFKPLLLTDVERERERAR